MLKLYNTLTKQKEEFKPINPGKVGMYSCGPTVYSKIHIGNLRAYTVADVLRRYLEYLGFEVRHIKNITDVGHLTDDDVAQGDSGEDKMQKAASKEKKTPEEIARFYENYAKETELDLNIEPAHFFPRATKHIPQMIDIIKTLLDKGYAYEKNGNVFFDVEKDKEYGKLSGNTLEKLNIGSRLSEPHPDKKNQWDFALWLKAPKEHIMKWESPWSLGYPGWHIECSAMSMEYLGPTFDIHTGGEDNIFPHHEAEIAQSECANDKKFVNYWIHTRHLLFDGEKMSKSKGTFLTLEDVINKGFGAKDLRMIYLLSHYRSPMNFTWNSLKQAQNNQKTLENFLLRLSEYKNSTNSPQEELLQAKKDFEQAMNNDLNTPKAISVILDLISKLNSKMDKQEELNAVEIKNFFKKILNALGIIIPKTQDTIPKEILELAKEREIARKNKNYKLSDELRGLIAKKGFEIKDSSDGFVINKK